jgi:colanic acid biosynthesis glycosyl transferase WcaI
MKILVYGLNYAPELIGIGKYTHEMCEWLAGRGHVLRVVTSYPYYPEWRVTAPYRHRRFTREERNGVDLVRCPLYVPHNPTGLKRLANHLSFAATSAPAVMRHALSFRPDIVFTIAPSLFDAPMALSAARLSGARAWLHIQDFEVDSAFELGILSGGFLRRFAEAGERMLLRRFDRVSTISPKMTERLAAKGVAPDRIIEFRNWVDTAFIRPLDRTTSYRATLGLSPDTIVALYSGSMALKQGLESVVDAAEAIARQRSDVCFIFCGTGAMRDRLVARSGTLPNVRFLDLQPRERLPELLATADIHLLPQRARIADLVLPSKLSAMLASGRPVIATAEKGTQLAAEVENCGLVIPAEDAQALATAILTLADDAPLRNRLGENARGAALARWDSAAILTRLEAHLHGLMDRSRQKATAAQDIS